MRRFLPLLLLVSFACSDAPSETPAPEQQESTDAVEEEALDPTQVVTLTDTSEVDPAVLELVAEHVAAVRADPTNGDLHGELGIVYEANTMRHEAERCYENAAALSDPPEPWLFRLAVVQRLNGDLPAALETMRRVAAAYTSTVAVQYRLGEMAYESGLFDEAEKAFARAVEVGPGIPEPLVGLARVKLWKGETEEAIRLAGQAVDLDGSYRAAHFTLGQALKAAGRDEEAARELALGVDAPERYPVDPHSAKLAGYVRGFGSTMRDVEQLLDRGSIADARSRLEALLAERPDDRFVLRLLAETYTREGRHDRALELLSQCEKAHPDDFETQLKLALALANVNRLGEALVHADRAVTLAPQLGRTHFYRAIVLARSGRIQDAYIAARAAEARGCREPQLYLFLAQLASGNQRPAEAKRYAELAVKKEPGNPAAHLALCGAEAALGNVAAARKALSAAREIAPDLPDIRNMELYISSLEQRR